MRVRRVVTTRAGGASRPPYDTFNLGDHVGDDAGDVYANRKRLATELGLAEDRLAWMEQVHGRTATIVDGSETSAAEATDALVTAEPGLALVVLVADCVPLLLADAEAGVVAAVHAGRVGARVGVVPAAVEAMRSVGAEPARTEALLGPAICGDCYEVPADMAADVEKHVPGSACKTRKGRRASTCAPGSGGSWPTSASARSASIRAVPTKTRPSSASAATAPRAGSRVSRGWTRRE